MKKIQIVFFRASDRFPSTAVYTSTTANILNKWKQKITAACFVMYRGQYTKCLDLNNPWIYHGCMARIARVVLPDVPHLVTQRGNRGQPTFFSDEDYQFYLNLLSEWCRRKGVEIWAYCLMPNHVHLIATPDGETGLRLAIGEAHRRYTRHVNLIKQWRGHLWQERFASFPMDKNHLLAATRYVELNPVRARLVENAVDYPWSSAKAHLSGKNDIMVKSIALLDLIGDWPLFLATGLADDEADRLRLHEKTGRPLGNELFIAQAEKRTKRRLRPLPRGPKPKKPAFDAVRR